MLKAYEVESRKGKLTKVIATSKDEVKKYVDNNKSDFNLDMSGYYKVHYLKDENVIVNYDEFENEEVIINGEWDISAHVA